MSMNTDVLIELKFSFTSKFNIVQQVFVLEEVEMGQKENNGTQTIQIIGIY